MKFPKIHLYPQEEEHANAAIVGNREGLEALKKAIDMALESDNKNDYGMTKARVTAEPEDGETYYLDVHYLPSENKNWTHLALPYAENKDPRMKNDDQDFLEPPSWGFGIYRRLDAIDFEAGKWNKLSKEDEEVFWKYSALSDEEKRAFKSKLREYE